MRSLSLKKRGYDVDLNDYDRLAQFRDHLQAISNETKKKAVVIKTNLRKLHILSSFSWGHTHGGALVAIGHLMNDVSRLIISSSFPIFNNKPWGSHWLTDHLWSSARVKIEHFGESFWRNEKLRQIADEPLVQNYLRVCCENRNFSLNCGHCEKCLRTMLILDQNNRLCKFTKIFPTQMNMASDIDKLSFIPPNLILVYKEILKKGLNPEFAFAIKNLIKRSNKRKSLSHPIFRKIIGKLWKPIPLNIRQTIKCLFQYSKSKNS